MRNEFTAVFAKAEEGGYWAFTLEIPAYGQGETLEACRQDLITMVRSVLDDQRVTQRQEVPEGSWEEILVVDA
jgi:predicted RNase H-like HicB family nuclease